MTTRAIAAAVLLSAVLVTAARAESAREVGWGDLLPPALVAAEREAFALGTSLARRPPDVREAYLQVDLERRRPGNNICYTCVAAA